MKDFAEIFEKYTDDNKMHHFEGESGVRNLEKIARDVEYGSLAHMLADNPFLQQALVTAISEYQPIEGTWSESLAEQLEDPSWAYDDDNEDGIYDGDDY